MAQEMAVERYSSAVLGRRWKKYLLSLLVRREALAQRAEGLTAGVNGYESVPTFTPGESYRGQGALEPARATVTSAQPPGGRALRAGEYHDGLQALRGIAAMGVFCQHLFWQASLLAPGPIDRLYALSLGGIGVLTFFALSGFLIFAKAGDPPLKFLLDRARRIFPSFWLAIAIALLAMRFTRAPMAVPWDIVFLVPTGRPNRLPLPHWSLYFEWFFYTLVLLVALVRISWVRPAVLIWAVFAFALYERPYNFANYNAPDLYNLVFPLYAIYFAGGVLAGWRFTPTPGAMIPYALASIIAFNASQVLAWLKISSHIPVWARLDLAFAFVLLGALCAVRAALCWQPRWFFGKALKALGDASYGIYLIHLVGMSVAVRLIKSVHTPASYLVNLVLILALALPPAFLFGLLDVRLQRTLKRLQPRLNQGQGERRGKTSPLRRVTGS
jgi:exopolysaccharide production protein ExoZ